MFECVYDLVECAQLFWPIDNIKVTNHKKKFILCNEINYTYIQIKIYLEYKMVCKQHTTHTEYKHK